MKCLTLGLLAIALVGCTESGNQRADQVGNTVVGQSMARGKDAQCMSNIKQVRAALEVFKSTSEDGAGPSNLSELRLSADMVKDPIGGEAYEYDPVAGTVKCPHPGHGKY